MPAATDGSTRGPRPKSRNFSALVRRVGSCPKGLAVGDRLVFAHGSLVLNDSSSACAYALLDLIPFVRRMEKLLDRGKPKLLAEPVFCTSCPQTGAGVEFSLTHLADRRSTERERLPELERSLGKLKRFPLLAPLPDSTLLRIAGRIREISVAAGTTILGQGERGSRLFLLERGKVEVRQRGKDGEEKVVATIGEGECFGEMSLLTGEPTSAAICATTPVDLLTLERRDFEALLVRNPGMNLYFSRLLSSRLQATSERTRRIRSGMAGDLGDFAPTDLLQALHLTERSGRLQLVHDDERVVVHFEHGQPVRVDLDERDEDGPEEAIYRVLEWTSGSFRFEKAKGKVERTFFKDMTALLLEGMRRRDEQGADLCDEELFEG